MLLSKQKNQQTYDQKMSSGEKGKALNEMCAGLTPFRRAVVFSYSIPWQNVFRQELYSPTGTSDENFSKSTFFSRCGI